MIFEPTRVQVHKRKRGSKWRLDVLYDPGHRPVYLMSYKHKSDAVTAAHALAKHLHRPVDVYTTEGRLDYTKEYK